jgi:hypothetical protein
MFKSTSRTLLKVVSLLVCLTFISGCGTQESAEPSNSQTSPKWNKTLNETDLFELKVPLTQYATWGFEEASESEFYIKSYSDPGRRYEAFEQNSATPDYCLPVVSLVHDSKASGADLFFYHSVSKSIFNYFSIGVRVYSSPELAKSKFDAMYSVKEKCSSYITKYSSGQTNPEFNLGTESPSPSPDSVYWEYANYDQVFSIGIVGATIYSLSGSFDGELPKAIKVREQAQAYIEAALEAKQL